MDTTTVICGLMALAAALPAVDAWLRQRRLTRPVGPFEAGENPGRLLVVVPARNEGARVGDIARDVRREGNEEKSETSLKEREALAAGGASPGGTRSRIDVLVVLDGPDPDSEARLVRDNVKYLSKKSPGPAKGHALAFLAASMGDRLDTYDFILVFDADMRLPEGFFRDLAIPAGTEAFQLPVRPAGIPGTGAARVEALSLAEALQDDLSRDRDGLPVRLRGKAMGFSPRAFRLGPGAATRTTVEDSEATLTLLAEGVRIRALAAPIAWDEPSHDVGGMARSRSRWFAGHLRLLAAGVRDLARMATRSPKGAFVLACDLWLRPRLFVWLSLAFFAGVSDVALIVLSSTGRWAGGIQERPVALLICLLLLSLEAKLALVLEGLSLVAVRGRIGHSPDVPSVSLSDLSASLTMWMGATVRAALAPSRWHRARPPA